MLSVYNVYVHSCFITKKYAIRICSFQVEQSQEKNKNKPIRDSMILRLADYKPSNLKLESTRPSKKLNFVYVMNTSAIGFSNFPTVLEHIIAIHAGLH